VIRSIVRSAVVLLGAVALVGGLVGQGRAVADEGGPTSADVIRVAGNDFDTYDDDGHRRYDCYRGYGYSDDYYYDGYYSDGHHYGYYYPYDHRYRDRCRRYHDDDDRYYYHRGDHDGDHDGDRDFPDRRRGRNHDDD
jgi:hypothetical protein